MAEQSNIKISCKERIVMILCPYQHLCSPSLVSKDCCLCCHEAPLQNIITIPPLIEMAGTWTSPHNPIPIWFIIIRILFTLCMIYIACFGFIYLAVQHQAPYYFAYFTYWNHLISTILMIVKCISTLKVYRKINKNQSEQNKILDVSDKLWKLYIFQWVLLQIALPGLSLTSFNFHVVRGFHPTTSSASRIEMIDSMQDHVVNIGIIWLDYILSAERIYYKSCFWSVAWGTVYTIFTIIFQILGGENENGDPYLYKAYDWKTSMKPIAYYFECVAVLSMFAILAAFVKNMIVICSGFGRYQYRECSETNNELEEDETSALDTLL